MYDPIQPQPATESVVLLRHYSNTLKASENYKRMITWFETSPTFAVVQYKGKLPAGLPHGNSKRNTDPYTRTPVQTMDRIKEGVKTKPVNNVYTGLVNEFKDTYDAPRNSRQIHDAKYREKNKGIRDKLYRYTMYFFAYKMQMFTKRSIQ